MPKFPWSKNSRFREIFNHLICITGIKKGIGNLQNHKGYLESLHKEKGGKI